jgi:hypothetical protein
MSDAPVSVVLDLRRFHDRPTCARQYGVLWAEVEARLLGQDLRTNPAPRVDLDDRGAVTLWVLHPESCPPRIEQSTSFAVRSVLEPAVIRHVCTTCQASQVTRYGPFTCMKCGTDDRLGRACEDHVVILDGSMQSTCLQHVPICACGKAATFWCNGPRCRQGTAWCDSHRAQHPSDPGTPYCPSCRAELFPACWVAACRGTGSITCEFVERHATDRCGLKVCPPHAQRWQVYGPHRRGLGLCQRHADRLRQLSGLDLVFEIVAGTAVRQQSISGHRQEGVRLPRLTIVRHIFINVCGQVLDMATLDGYFASLRQTLGRNQMERRMAELIDRNAATRAEDRRKFDSDQQIGRQLFEQLRELLVSFGQQDLAARTSFSDFKPRDRILFVHVPEHLRGLFIGTRGANISRLNEALNVRVQLEKR